MFRTSARRILWRGVLRLQLAAWAPRALLRWRARRYQRISWFPANVSSPEFARRVDLIERRISSQLPAPRNERNWYGLSPVVFASQIHDSLAKSMGIEARHPFHDQDLVEFCLRLPYEQRLRFGWTRWILRRALASDLPASVRYRLDKGTQGTNGQIKLATVEQEKLRSGLDPLPRAISKFASGSAVRDHLNRFLSAPRERSNDASYSAAYVVHVLGRWLEKNPLGLSW